MPDTKQCPFCAEEIQAAAIKCRLCGEMLGDEATPEPAVASPPTSPDGLIGAIVCFVLGMALMTWSLTTFFVYLPLFFVAFVLSIVAIAQGRTWTGVMSLLVVIVVPALIWFVLAATRSIDLLDLPGLSTTSPSSTESADPPDTFRSILNAVDEEQSAYISSSIELVDVRVAPGTRFGQSTTERLRHCREQRGSHRRSRHSTRLLPRRSGQSCW